jgi:mono/diheme cytochrome c family protein
MREFLRIGAVIVLAGSCVAGATLRASQAARSVWDGVYTSEQAQRGASEFASHCAACHGANLAGLGGAPPLAGQKFLYNWDGLPLEALFDRTQITMPMDHPGSLSREAAAAITGFILSSNGIPAGTTALSDDAETLKSIRLDAKRPH